MKNLFTALLALVVLGLAAFGVWNLIPRGKRVPDLGPFMQPLMERTVAAAVDTFPREAMPDAVFVLPLRGDVRELAHAALTAELSERGLARIIGQASLGEQLGGPGTLGTILKNLLGADPTVPIDREKAREFLERGDRVQFSLRFRSRELAHVEVGVEVFARIKTTLADVSKVERDCRREGRRITMVLAPVTKQRTQTPNGDSAGD